MVQYKFQPSVISIIIVEVVPTENQQSIYEINSFRRKYCVTNRGDKCLQKLFRLRILMRKHGALGIAVELVELNYLLKAHFSMWLPYNLVE